MFFRRAASIVAAAFLVAAGCAQGPSADTENRPVGPDGWLKGTTDEVSVTCCKLTERITS
jgi:hypothetical protein